MSWGSVWQTAPWHLPLAEWRSFGYVYTAPAGSSTLSYQQPLLAGAAVMSSEIRADLLTSPFIDGKRSLKRDKLGKKFFKKKRKQHNRTSVTSAVGRSTVFQLLPGFFSKASYFYFFQQEKRRKTCGRISHAPPVIADVAR